MYIEDKSITYTYNADGLRTSKTVNGTVTTHIWDGNQIAIELGGTGTLINKYVRGVNLLYAENGSGANKKFYLYNGHGDVVQLTNSSGQVLDKNGNIIAGGQIHLTYDYDAFGNEKNISPTDTNVFRYCGEYFDRETGTIYLRARYYDPEIGRFISEDSYRGKAEDPLSLNLYAYCQGNPIRYTDPSGHTVTPPNFGYDESEGTPSYVSPSFNVRTFFRQLTGRTNVQQVNNYTSPNINYTSPNTKYTLFPKTQVINSNSGINKTGSTALTVYDPKFAAQQLLKDGKVPLENLQSMVRKDAVNTFKPSATITDGYKYYYTINGTKIEIKWHAPDANAAAKFPGNNSGSEWTAQIKVGNKLLGQDGKFYKNYSNITHIPVEGIK